MHTANKKKNLRPYLFDLKTVLNSAFKCLLTCGNDPQIVDPFQQKFFFGQNFVQNVRHLNAQV